MALRTPAKPLFVVLTILCLLLASGGSSEARGPRKKKQKPVPTTITIDSVTGSTVAGTVSSKNAACVSGREVTFVVDDEDAGSTAADADGKWSDKPDVVVQSGDEIVVEVNKLKAGKRKCGPASDSVVVGNDGGGSTTYLASVTVSGAGLVRSDPAGISCRSGGGACAVSFPAGSVVALSAVPDANQLRVAWGGSCSATSSTCTLRMTANRRASMTFTGPSDVCSVSESVPQLIRGLLCLIL